LAVEIIATLMGSLGAADDYQAAEAADPGDDLYEKRKLKYILREVISTFNEKPRDSLKMMNDLRLIESETDYTGIVKILRKSRALINKKTLGLFLADKSPNSPAPFVLNELMIEFDFKGLRIDQALRVLMHDIRLPGEGQQIERILDAFAESFFKQNPQDPTFKDADSVCILSYAIIMLNTDQHSQQLRSRDRMNVEAFVKNVSKCNKGEDFPRDFLQAIYDAVRMQEIIVPEEHDGGLGFSYLWSDVLKKNEDIIATESSARYLKQIVVLLWDPLLETLVKGIYG
jgi:golgi-specific brefeldin A-resistance guanine nucleotide exchange factor 1